jgi:hypothetical protein
MATGKGFELNFIIRDTVYNTATTSAVPSRLMSTPAC